MTQEACVCNRLRNVGIRQAVLMSSEAPSTRRLCEAMIPGQHRPLAAVPGHQAL